MNLDDAMDYSPTEIEARRELSLHGCEWSELIEYCGEYGLDWSAPGVLLGFLGY
jgi:hypothetical protein